MKTKVFVIQEDPMEGPMHTLEIFSTKEKAEEYIEYMKNIVTDAKDWFITEMNFDFEDYRGKTHFYHIYIHGQNPEYANVSSADYYDMREHIDTWGEHINKDTKDAIVYI